MVDGRVGPMKPGRAARFDRRDHRAERWELSAIFHLMALQAAARHDREIALRPVNVVTGRACHRGALLKTGAALEQLNQTAGSSAPLVGPRGGFPKDLERTLESVQRAAVSIERLADYLERHPSALLRGRADSSANPR